ncbi:hypothetical protein FHY26_004430 [Xanthomonas campestris]|nr:hypothetical protein XCCB1459_2972 [Xanthomonas campestris pv. campestris]
MTATTPAMMNGVADFLGWANLVFSVIDFPRADNSLDI